MPLVWMPLYAQAAVGPEYEYPACGAMTARAAPHVTCASLSHLVSCCESSTPLLEYHEPACVGRREVIAFRVPLRRESDETSTHHLLNARRKNRSFVMISVTSST